MIRNSNTWFFDGFKKKKNLSALKCYKRFQPQESIGGKLWYPSATDSIISLSGKHPFLNLANWKHSTLNFGFSR